ncbi:sulfur oxidation c-type cytochrome SoxA [Pseudoduganella sp. OTU4001]|uniref:sulfur oxidation c-type cytochrome SoxA n=1 Tax=Pseudoduganella sp. OTU4001 TaxID=3043854 RepID=UPI00313C3E47
MKPLIALLLTLATAIALAAGAPDAPARKSGADYMSPATQAMQRDDTQNPAMLWVANGETLWAAAPPGGNGKSCATCHSDAKQSMRGKAASFPRFSRSAGKVITLSDQINQCRASAQQAPALKPESEDLLALEAYIGLQSRGLPMQPATDAQTRQAAARGQKLFTTRIGQLNLSCAQCHDNNDGKRLAGALIPQGHANAYPIYRLEWQSVGSLQRRLRNCMNGVRAEVPPYGAPDLVDLEAYLAQRAKGMSIETPGVRP